MLKIILFIASALPAIVFVKTLLFRRSSGVRAAASNFDRQVGYLATGIAIIIALSVIWYFISRLNP